MSTKAASSPSLTLVAAASHPVRPRGRALAARILASFVASAVAAAGFTTASCAAPPLAPRGYPLRSVAANYELQVLIEGTPAPTFQHAGETYIMGQLGARYTLRILNHTGRRIEAVASVDGRDAMDGKPADVRSKRGYVVPAWGSVDIDGWRLSHAEAAAFRFSSVADSYAARTGSAREVGVIGVAVFPERIAPPPYAYVPVYPQQPPLWRDAVRSRGEAAKSLRKMAPDDSASAEASNARRKGDGAENESAGLPRPSSASAPPAPSAALGAGEALAQGQAAPPPSRRPGLGTEFGEAVTSRIQDVSFTRANFSHPAVVLGARYNDREGLLALGINVGGCCGNDDRDQDLAARQSASPFPVSDRGRYASPPAGWQRGCCVGY